MQSIRYDVRLILDSLPTHPEERQPTSSPSGWSDLPSDTEDTFFFGREEVEDYRRDKRRRLMESVREERLKALAQLESANEPQETCWASDEEVRVSDALRLIDILRISHLALNVKQPDTAQKDLMQRTALHIQSSPNPAQLEMRILANHGADHRFAFLRGRWSKHWKAATDHARNEMLKRDEPAGLGGLAGYGSDDDSDVDNSK